MILFWIIDNLNYLSGLILTSDLKWEKKNDCCKRCKSYECLHCAIVKYFLDSRHITSQLLKFLLFFLSSFCQTCLNCHCASAAMTMVTFKLNGTSHSLDGMFTSLWRICLKLKLWRGKSPVFTDEPGPVHQRGHSPDWDQGVLCWGRVWGLHCHCQQGGDLKIS